MVQSRIAAFESFAPKPHAVTRGVEASPKSTLPSPSPSPPNLGRKTSLIDLKDWIVDDDPSVDGTAQGRATNQLTRGQRFDTNRQFIPPLIQFESFPLSGTFPGTAPPLPPRKPSLNSLKSSTSSGSLVSLGSSNGIGNLSLYSDSLAVDRPHTYPPVKFDRHSSPKIILKHAPASSVSSFHSVSLSLDTDSRTPDSLSNHKATFLMDHNLERQAPGSSDQSSEADSISLADSYEEVSTPSLASPTTEQIIARDWEKVAAKWSRPAPPKLPQRPSSGTITPPSASSTKQASRSLPPPRPSFRPHIPPSSIPSTSGSCPAPTSTSRRVPPLPSPLPLPVSRSPDRSSSQSLSSNCSYSSKTPTQCLPSSSKAKRPTPVPAAARVRYIAVFNTNALQCRKAEKQKEKDKPPLLGPTEAKKTRQAAGWRGLSVDLITGCDDLVSVTSSEEEEQEDDMVNDTKRLEGHIVRAIWVRSRLNRMKLRDIW